MTYLFVNFVKVLLYFCYIFLNKDGAKEIPKFRKEQIKRDVYLKPNGYDSEYS